MQGGCTKVAEQGIGGNGAVVRYFQNRGSEVMNRLYERIGVADGRFLIVYTKEVEWRMGGDGSFVRKERSGGWEVTNRLYEGNGAEDGR